MSSSESSSKIFVRGIPVKIKREEIIEFFSQFGKIRHCKLKKNSKTGRSVGYAYITYESMEDAAKLLNKQVEFSGRLCECKPVIPKEELQEKLQDERKRRLLVWNLNQLTSNQALQEAFQKVTKVEYAYVVKDADCPTSKGYGYVFMQDEESMQLLLLNNPKVTIDGRLVKYSNEDPLPPKKKSNLLHTADSSDIGYANVKSGSDSDKTSTPVKADLPRYSRGFEHIAAYHIKRHQEEVQGSSNADLPSCKQGKLAFEGREPRAETMTEFSNLSFNYQSRHRVNHLCQRPPNGYSHISHPSEEAQLGGQEDVYPLLRAVSRKLDGHPTNYRINRGFISDVGSKYMAKGQFPRCTLPSPTGLYW